MVVDRIWFNVTRYFLAPGFQLDHVFKYAIVASCVAALIYGAVKRQRLVVAVGLIGAAHLFFLFALYDAYDWREHRLLASVMYLLFIVFVYARAFRVAGVLYVLMIVLLPQAYGDVRHTLVPARRAMGAAYVPDREPCAGFARLAPHVRSADGAIITVLYANAFFGDRQLFDLCVSLQNTDGVPVRYTTSLEGDGLRRWGRLRIDYVLTPSTFDEPEYTLIHEEQGYRLYEAER